MDDCSRVKYSFMGDSLSRPGRISAHEDMQEFQAVEQAHSVKAMLPLMKIRSTIRAVCGKSGETSHIIRDFTELMAAEFECYCSATALNL